MDLKKIEFLASKHNYSFRYFHNIDSTNEEAKRWIETESPNRAFVIADTQSQGRGRENRPWHTQPGSSIAISLIISPSEIEMDSLSLFPCRAGIAACFAIENLSETIKPRIKWPNDILINGQKSAGILVESTWEADRLSGLVIGVGINLNRGSAPDEKDLRYPATCIEKETGKKIDRVQFLDTFLDSFQKVREIDIETLIEAYTERLAFLGNTVTIEKPGSFISGKITGISTDGSLLLINDEKKIIPINMGEIIHLHFDKTTGRS